MSVKMVQACKTKTNSPTQVLVTAYLLEGERERERETWCKAIVMKDLSYIKFHESLIQDLVQWH